MIVNVIVSKLARLASLPFQERWVIGGNIDEYVRDDELLEDVDSLQYLLALPENRVAVSDVQMAALSDLISCISANSGEALAANSREEAADLMRHSVIWNTLRTKAANTLELFGMSISNLSVDDIDRMSE